MGQASCCAKDGAGQHIGGGHDDAQVHKGDADGDMSPRDGPSMGFPPASNNRFNKDARPGPEMRVEFEMPCGTKKAVSFLRRPLGLDFNKSNPIKMKRIQKDTHGEELGVEAGWIVVGVNG